MTDRKTCTRCRSRNALPGASRCRRCRDTERSHDAERRASDWCVTCHVVRRVEGRTRCAGCAQQARVKAAALRAARIEAGQCVTCGAPAVSGLTLCAKHRAYYAQRA